MRRSTRLALVAVVALALAGCSNGSPSAVTVDVPTATAAAAAPTAAAPTSPSAPTSSRGYLIKNVGDTSGFGTTTDITVKWVVDKITVDPQCTNRFSSKPEHGHFVQLDVRMETTPSMEPNSGFSLNPFSWSAVGPDGVTEQSIVTGSSYMCIDSNKQLPTQMTPGSKYRGSLVFDVSGPTGTLLFPHPNPSLGGWEWNYGAA